MAFVNIAFQRIQALQVLLMDLHDPSGAHFHRAWSACLAGLMAAVVLYFAATIAQPLLVIAAIIFMHTTSELDRPRRPTVLLGSLIVALLNASLLSLTQPQPVLQGAVLIGSGFLAQYLIQFGQAFTAGTLTWILSVIANTENPTVEQLPVTWLNLTLGFLIAYFCYFWIAPYRPQRVFLSVLNRTRSRLVERLQSIVDDLNPQTDHWCSPAMQPNRSLDRRIVSLMNTEDTLLNKLEQPQLPGDAIAANKRILVNKQVLRIAHYREMLTAQRDLFEAILVLEQSLLILKSAVDVPLPLQLGLLQAIRQAAAVLGQASPSQMLGSRLQLNADFEQWLQDFVSNFPSGETLRHSQIPTETQIQKQNVFRAIHILLSKVNAVAGAHA